VSEAVAALIDTGQETVAYFRGDSPVVHAEGFERATRVWVAEAVRGMLERTGEGWEEVVP
jgi:hypothetical protein